MTRTHSLLDTYKHLAWRGAFGACVRTHPPLFLWNDVVRMDDMAQAWRETFTLIGETPKRRHRLSLYIHIPFCFTQCFFCTCIMRVSHDEREYDTYIDHLEREIEYYAPLFRGQKFDTVYFGGGTPSIFRADQIDRLFTLLHRAFDLSSVEQTLMEASPHTTTDEKVAVFARHGVDRMSFGVQTLDPKVLSRNHRTQNLEEVRTCIELSRKYGIEHINLDIMVGLPGQDCSSLEATIRAVEDDLHPTTVEINPFIPTSYTNFTKTWGVYSADDIRRRADLERFARQRFGLSGSDDGPDDPDATDASTTNLYARDYYLLNGSILGLGWWAMNHTFGTLHTFCGDPYPKWRERGIADRTFTACRMRIEDEMTAHIAENLREGLSPRVFYSIFHVLLEKSPMYPKIEMLLQKGILVRGESGDDGYITFSDRREIFSAIFMQYFYDSRRIAEFVRYMYTHSDEFEAVDPDARLRQFFME